MRLLAAAWGAGATSMLLPAYHGEVIAPGSAVTLLNFQLALFGFVFGFGQPGLFLMATLPITLYLFTPLALIRRMTRRRLVAAIWGILLMLSAAAPLAAAREPLGGVNDRLFGFYLLPAPLLLAGVALCVLGYVGQLHRRAAHLSSMGRCAQCAYDLRGGPHHPCPECGHVHQADQDATS